MTEDRFGIERLGIQLVIYLFVHKDTPQHYVSKATSDVEYRDVVEGNSLNGHFFQRFDQPSLGRVDEP